MQDATYTDGKNILIHIYVHMKKVGCKWTSNLLITSPMRYRYT